MKNKLKIIIPIGIAIIAIALAFVFIRFTPSQKVDINAIISTAQQYIIEQNYEAAIVQFKKALQIDPRNVEAYIGIAQAYEAIGDTESALEWLHKGYDLTGDSSLKAEIDRISGLAEDVVTVAETTVTNIPTMTTEETTTTKTVESYTDEELTEVLKQLIENPDAEIEQAKLDAIKYVRIIGQDFIYAGSVDYDSDIKMYGNGDGKTYTLTFADETSNTYSYGKYTNLEFLGKLNNLLKVKVLYNQISDLSALSNLKNLKWLHLWNNQISDISALGKLTSLENVNLDNNQISNVGALSNLTNLELLVLNQNQISDISALSNLKNLKWLYLNDNQICDISALSNLTNLNSLYWYYNPINQEEIDKLKESLPNCDIS